MRQNHSKQINDTGTPRHARVDPRSHDKRTMTFTLKLFLSEVEELAHLAAVANRTPGEQLRHVLHLAVRVARAAPNWIPPELDKQLEARDDRREGSGNGHRHR